MFKKKKKDSKNENLEFTYDLKHKQSSVHEVSKEEDNSINLTDFDENDDSLDCGLSVTAKSGKKGLFAKLKKGLSKTRKVLSGETSGLFKSKKYVDDDVLEGLEELLITSDFGSEITLELIKKVSRRKASITSEKNLKNVLREEILKYFYNKNYDCICDSVPLVVMVVGVNGVGKTTTIGKLAALESVRGKKVLVAAADTFRAAGVEQIEICAKRAGASVVKHRPNADPAAVAYDGVSAAISREIDTVFIDTAGRLHNNVNLMNELKKIDRSITKKLDGLSHEVLLVLDATTGQNAITQTEKFGEILGLTGIILTKLDGTAKGGVVINISRKFDLPIRYIGVGEGVNDLHKFDPEWFVDAIL